MEKHENEADLKAKKLISQFTGKFKNIDFTLHQLKAG